MKKVLLFGGCWLITVCLAGQPVSERLQKAYQQFSIDSQLRHAISSLYVIDAHTGEVVFDHNAQVGLAPASTQKIITSVTAFEILGQSFRYSTQMALDQTNGNTVLRFYATGDPTFGSWRWQHTSEYEVRKRWVQAIQQARLKKIDTVFFDTGGWDAETIPDGWIWQDIGNYYGAGAELLNWRENQFDIILASGAQIGDEVSIVKTIPRLHDIVLQSRLRSAAKGTGDNAYVYFPFDIREGIVRGTIPIAEKNFKISAALPSGSHQFFSSLFDTLRSLGITVPPKPVHSFVGKNHTRDLHVIQEHVSPPMDSIIYWFNKRSINLYGEALIKTMGAKVTGEGSTDSGTAVLRRFWKEKGVDPDALNLFDGSGLSPLNRVTTHAQVAVLKYARGRGWFSSFFNSLPEYNGMKIKSGTISDVKGFCGYHHSKEGRDYIFSFLVNNYNGRASSLVGKMYKVLDILK